jgi:dienelactone hydrolase
MKLVCAVLLVVALGGCGGSHRAVEPVSFRSGSETVAAYLVRPPGSGRRPAVVLVHGSGGDRRELLAQAHALAAQGIVALTITEPSSAHPSPPPGSLAQLLASSQRDWKRDVAAVNAAASYLAARDDVASGRLGYLGWSAGAKTGAFVIRRFRALALLSAGAQPVAAFVAAAPPGARTQVRTVLTNIDPIAALRGSPAGRVLLEDGRRDEIVPRAALLQIVRAAPRGTTVRWYDTGHALSDRAYADARSWLVARLRS